MSNITVDFTSYLTATGTNGPYSAGDTVTIADTSTVLNALTTAQIDALGTNNVDILSSTSGAVNWSAAQMSHFVATAVVFDAPTVTTLVDTGANIGAMTVSDISKLKAHGVDTIDANDNAISFSIAQMNALSGTTLAGADTITLSDTQSNLQALSGSQYLTMFNRGVDVIHSQSGVLTVSTPQLSTFYAHPSMHFLASDVVTWSSTGDDIALNDPAVLAQALGTGVDLIDSTTNVLALTAAQYTSIYGVGTHFTVADDFTIYDDGSSLNTMLHISGIKAEMTTDGVNTLQSYDGNTSVDAAAIAGIDGSGAVFYTDDSVTLSDTGANIGNVTIADLAGLHVDTIDATDNVVYLTEAEYSALGGVTIAANDVVTLKDTAANLGALTTVHIGTLAGKFEALKVSDGNTLSLSLAQLDALATAVIALNAADTIKLTDTASAIKGLTATQIGAYVTQGVDQIDASDSSAYSLTKAQIAAAIPNATFSDTVTMADTGANIATLTVTQCSQLYAHGVQFIDATDNTLSLTGGQYFALGAALTSADTVTIADTNTNISAFTASQIMALAANFIDKIDASGNAITWDASKAHALVNQTGGGTVAIDASDTITISDTGAHLTAMTVSDLTALTALGTIKLDASDNAYSLSLAQFGALTGFTAAATDTVTIADTAANLQALSTTAIAALGTAGIAAVHATGGALSLSQDTVDAFATAGVDFTSADTVTMTLSASALGGLNATALGNYVTQGIDTFAVSPSGAVSLSIAQFDAVHGSGASFTGLGALTIADSGTNLSALTGTELSAFAASGATSVTLDASDNALSLSLAQLNSLHTNHVGLTAGDTITVLDTQTNIQNLTAASISLLLANGIDVFSASGGTLNMNALQVKAVLDGDGAFASGNTVTLADTGAHIASLSAAQLQALTAAGVDAIDASNDKLSLTVAQYQGLGNVHLTGGDTVTLADTGAHLAGLASFSALAAAGIDRLDASDDQLTLTVAQYNALGGVKLTAADTVTLSDTGAALSALTLSEIRALAHGGIDKIDASDNVLSLSVDEFNAITKGLAFAADDAVTLTDLGHRFETMSAAKLAGLSAQGVDGIDATDNAISFSNAQYTALGSLHLAADDTITVQGTAGNDTIQGDNGTLVLRGGAGSDTLGAGAGDNTLDGGAGIDTASYVSATGGVSANLATGTGTTTTGHDIYIGIENVAGSNYADTITGNGGENVLTGNGGDDVLIGGSGADVLAGNFGADTFAYLSVSDSTASHTDVITDFSHAEGDKIDVSGIGSFSFVQSFDYHAGELSVTDQGGGVYQVAGDVDGDGNADLVIYVHSLTALTAGDFVL